jgi:hypothetical protein
MDIDGGGGGIISAFVDVLAAVCFTIASISSELFSRFAGGGGGAMAGFCSSGCRCCCLGGAPTAGGGGGGIDAGEFVSFGNVQLDCCVSLL